VLPKIYLVDTTLQTVEELGNFYSKQNWGLFENGSNFPRPRAVAYNKRVSESRISASVVIFVL
jgi:hypothetical protein